MSERKNIEVVKTCPKCGGEKAIHMSEAEFQNLINYYNGEGLIQDMIPDIPAPERELLRGGMCGECWRRIFGPPPWEKADDEGKE